MRGPFKLITAERYPTAARTGRLTRPIVGAGGDCARCVTGHPDCHDGELRQRGAPLVGDAVQLDPARLEEQ